MRTRLTSSILSIILALGTCTAFADVFDNPAWQKEVSISMNDCKFGQVLEALLRGTGIHYSIDPDTRLIRLPSIRCLNVSCKAAFESLIKSAGLTYQIDGDRIVVSVKPGTRNPWLTHVSIEANDAKLGQAIETLFRDTGINYVLDPDAANLHVKSLKIKDLTLYEALDAALENAGAKSLDKGGVPYIVPMSAPTTQPILRSSQVSVTLMSDGGDPWERRLDIQVRDARLAEVVEELLKSSGLNFSIDTDACYLSVDSLKMANVTRRQAFDSVMRKAGATYVEESGVVEVRAKEMPAAAKNPICLDLKDIPLPQALQTLFRGTGLSYRLDSSIGELRVTAKLDNVPFQSALQSLTNATGLTYRIDEGVYHIYSTSPVGATPQADVSADKCTQEISLKQAKADYIMQILGFGVDGHRINPQKPALNLPAVAQGVPEDPRTSFLVPAGIESVTPGKSESTLVIVGERKAVGELKSVIEGLDVKPKVVQITVEFYEVDSKQVIDLDELDKLVNEDNPAKAADAAKELKAKMDGVGATLLNKPILSVLNRTRGEMSVQTCIPPSSTSDAGKPIPTKGTVSVTPCVNDDGTLAMALDLSFDPGWQWEPGSGKYATKTQRLSTGRRAVAGEPILLGGFFTQPGKIAVVFVTAEILNQQQAEVSRTPIVNPQSKSLSDRSIRPTHH